MAGAADAVREAGIACFGPGARPRPARGQQGVRQGGHGGGRRPDRGRAVLHRPRREAAPRWTSSGRRTWSRTTVWPRARASSSPSDARGGARARAVRARPGGDRGVPGRPRGVAVRGAPTAGRAVPLLPAQDFKRVGDGDTGPEHRRDGRLRPAALGRRPDWSTRSWPRSSQPDGGRAGPPRAPRSPGLLYVGLALTARRDPGHRVQRPVRRPGDPGGAGPAGDAAGRAAARGRHR